MSAAADTQETAIGLEARHTEMLTYLAGVPGADVWSYADGRTGRELERLGLVRIVKAKNAPKNGAERQPYYGIKINVAGRAALAKAVSQ